MKASEEIDRLRHLQTACGGKESRDKQAARGARLNLPFLRIIVAVHDDPAMCRIGFTGNFPDGALDLGALLQSGGKKRELSATRALSTMLASAID